VVFSSAGADTQTSLVASEAAIASNLTNDHIVATYSHDIVGISEGVGPELGVYKFYLVQVLLSFFFFLAFRCFVTLQGFSRFFSDVTSQRVVKRNVLPVRRGTGRVTKRRSQYACHVHSDLN
jgi:hypothetical protein